METWTELRHRVMRQAQLLAEDCGMSLRECVAMVVRGMRAEARS